jgi:hypothetical protein
MKFRIILSLFVSFLIGFYAVSAKAQAIESVDTSDYEYENPTDSLFPGYNSARLIIDYYKTEGATIEDRYRYEIIMIDSLLSLTFRSPESGNFSYIDYQKERLLTNSEQSEIKQALAAAKLTQTKRGIPAAKFTGYAQEVLIIRSNTFNIAGGLAWSAIGDDNNAKTDRALTSSIGGNYDTFFAMLCRYFPDLNGLMEESAPRK